MSMDAADSNTSQFIIYQSEDGKTRLDVRFVDETVWLTQALMAELFSTTPENVLMHLKKIFNDGELAELATTKDFLVVRQEGVCQVRRRIGLQAYGRYHVPMQQARQLLPSGRQLRGVGWLQAGFASERGARQGDGCFATSGLSGEQWASFYEGLGSEGDLRLASGLVQAPGIEQIYHRPSLKTNFQVYQVAQRPLAFEINAGIAPDHIQGEPGAVLLDTLQGLQGAF